MNEGFGVFVVLFALISMVITIRRIDELEAGIIKHASAKGHNLY